ncbi:MAG: hypothetical protein WA734_01655 [Candidatus Acidiferrales bacterium]
MEDHFEGDGELERWNDPDGKHLARYQFTIISEIVEKRGFPRVASKQHGIGRVSSLTGESFPEGEYRLFAADKILKVLTSGFEHWEILASS